MGRGWGKEQSNATTERSISITFSFLSKARKSQTIQNPNYIRNLICRFISSRLMLIASPSTRNCWRMNFGCRGSIIWMEIHFFSFSFLSRIRCVCMRCHSDNDYNGQITEIRKRELLWLIPNEKRLCVERVVWSLLIWSNLHARARAANILFVRNRVQSK